MYVTTLFLFHFTTSWACSFTHKRNCIKYIYTI